MGIQPSEIQQLVSTRTPAMSFFHLNVRSLANKTVDMTTLLETFGITFTAILLTETWYTLASEVCCPDGYQYFFRNRHGKRGGGILLLVQDCVACDIVEEYSLVTPHYELVTVHSNKSLISVIYRPPSGDLNQFFSFTDNFFGYACRPLFRWRYKY